MNAFPVLVSRRDAGAEMRRRLLTELAELPRCEVDRIARALGYVPRTATSDEQVTK